MNRANIALAVGLAIEIAAAGHLPAQLSGTGVDFFTENDIGIYGPQNSDELGSSFAAGDFNGDGADDLATGVPLDNGSAGNPRPDSGIVILRYGAPGGGLVHGVSFAVISQASAGSPDPPEEDDWLGRGLAAGDFDGDGFDDLAVGIPGDRGSGSVQVHYGAAGGLSLTAGQWFHQDTPGIADDAEDGDDFGWSLAAGDFDNDGHDDLAIAAPFEDVGVFPSERMNSGLVHVIMGSSLGLDVSRAQLFHQDVSGMEDSVEAFDVFGFALAAGDFDDNDRDDLAIGVYGEDGDEDNAGGVHVLYGSPPGLTVTGNRFWTQDDPGVPGQGEDGDSFGWSLAAGDFDHNGADDLAVGIPFEDVDTASATVSRAGAVQTFLGGGVDLVPGDLWTAIAPGLAVAVQADALFGYALAAGDFARDGGADLAIGIHGQDVGHGAYEGVVLVLPGMPLAGGLRAEGSVVWRQGVNGVPNSGEQGDAFGGGLATGDFDGNGFADLVVGAPRESTVAVGDGAEWVIYGTWPPLPFADGFETGSTGRWAARYPCGGPCS
jgi:hypothetical protein